MSEVDANKFKPTKSFDVINGAAAGRAVTGVSAVLGNDEQSVVVLVAPNIEALEEWWNKVAPMPLKRDGIQQVAIFSQTAVQEIKP